jgi:uncharacterized membrane protein YedE/YeeE
VIARRGGPLQMTALGLGLGATVSGAGFTDYGELHRMFVLSDPRLPLTFFGAIGLAVAAFALLCRGTRLARRPIRKGTLPGAALFGIGWAVCGGCPGAVLAMLGEGQLVALVTLSGILAGTWLGRRLNSWLRWDPGSCGP